MLCHILEHVRRELGLGCPGPLAAQLINPNEEVKPIVAPEQLAPEFGLLFPSHFAIYSDVSCLDASGQPQRSYQGQFMRLIKANRSACGIQTASFVAYLH